MTTTTQYYTATTIDGFIADRDHSLDWLFEVPTGDDDVGHEARFGAFFDEIGAMAMGSSTYRWVLEHEQLLEHPEKWTEFYGTKPSWVFSSREQPAIPGADLRFVAGDVAPIHREMVEAADGKNVWLIGGGDLVGQFADVGLLDEIILSVAPVTLGEGMPVLPRRLTAKDLTLVDVERQGQMVALRYRVGSGDERH